jgi:carboxylesterase
LSAPATVPDAVFLVHGLGGTQYDLGSMHKRLKNAGLVTYSLTLPGHGTTPGDLLQVPAEAWVDAVAAKYRELVDQHPRLHLMGMCMGALLAALTAARAGTVSGKLTLLAPPIHIDGWATPWYRGLRPLLYAVPPLRRMKVEEEEPYGIKNEQLRAIVKAKFERGENFHYRWVPLECIRQVDRLRRWVMREAKDIRWPTLVVHARHDELTSLASPNFLCEAIGGARARMVVLEDSYHMVCVDNDREIVARNVLEFLGAALPGATLALVNEPRMSAAELDAAVAEATALLAGGALAGLRARGIPDLAFVLPGDNAASGAHAGRALPGLAARLAAAGDAHFTAFGTPAFNRGVALVPATLAARRDGAALASQGALLLAFHAGRLIEVRWVADDVAVEDAWFGPAPAQDVTASSLAAAFESAAVAVKALPRAPDNGALLDLYALYKQATAGDCDGQRPGAMDVVGRAKYDAWARRRGVAQDEAMRDYVSLVERLRGSRPAISSSAEALSSSAAGMR